METLKRLFGWIGSRLMLVLFFVVFIIVSSVVWDSTRDALAEIGGLEKAVELAKEDVTSATKDLISKTDLIGNAERELEKVKQESTWRNPHLIRKTELRVKILSLKRAKNKAEEVKRAAEETLRQTKKTLLDRTSSGFARIVRTLFSYQGLFWFVWGLIAVFFGPALWSVFMFYIVARYIERQKAHRLIEPPASGTSVEYSSAATSVDFRLEGKQRLYLRSVLGETTSGRSNLKARSKFVWSLRHILVSLASDMTNLSEYRVEKEKTSGGLTITSPRTGFYLLPVTLHGGAGLIVQPQSVVGVTDSIKVRTRWSWRFHSLLAGHLRYIILRGHGTVFLVGGNGFKCYDGNEDTKINRTLMVARTADSLVSLCRNECFLPYYHGTASLFDMRLHEGTMITQLRPGTFSQTENETFFEKVLRLFCNGIGSLLGF